MAPKKRPPIERFTEKTTPAENGCIEWTAYRGHNGYGRFYLDGRGALAHRWSYEFHVGPIPEGLVIDHLCRNPGCVNPEHLEPVTPQENVLRGVGPQVARERFLDRTNCAKGHPLSEAGSCPECKREGNRRHYLANRQKYIDKAAEWRHANPDRARELMRQAQSRQRAKKKEQVA